jgi:hypothetical protein
MFRTAAICFALVVAAACCVAARWDLTDMAAYSKEVAKINSVMSARTELNAKVYINRADYLKKAQELGLIPYLHVSNRYLYYRLNTAKSGREFHATRARRMQLSMIASLVLVFVIVLAGACAPAFANRRKR